MKSSLILFISTFTLLACLKEKKSNQASEKMQEFVIEISDYARNFDNDFIIIPQNGIELAFINTEITEGLNTSYIDAIDGIGVEELFYDGSYSSDNERLLMLQKIKESEKILVSEFLNEDTYISDALSRN